MKFEWGALRHKEYDRVLFITKRAKVFGGWIVNNETYINDKGDVISQSMVFVPDPEHKWEITKD